ncbi:hypothetical protein L1276_002068 [Flavobacterium sp. HSC-32F16]|uniref:energy transducer TonB n=1 Tax=Flavobacterium sp. HSC-32F16 TaxID=2910964 RepID=UPI0020A35038|nr:hypothetical protein [Flavobacterium sp. HSC-32F16]MCP2026924.1 hypothetical protein [Flavobacterium sp. HSC-32F16]
MERKYKITIPEPCHEDWNKMIPDERGRFCISCSKTVVDFTSMLPDEIQYFFIQNQNNKICGRFKKSQLNTITIQIPSRIIYSQTSYHRMFLLALFIAMGTTLFSCQDKNGNKQKIDQVEIIEDSIKQKTIVKNVLLKDSLNKKPLQPQKNKPFAQITLDLPEPAGIQVIENNYNEDIYILGGAGLLSFVPSYPGGIQKFYEAIQNRFQTPAKAKKSIGTIEASFSIEKDGSLNNIKIIDDIGDGTGEELVKVLKTTPKWMPGEENGKKTTNYYNLLITMQKDSLNDKRRKRKFSKITSVEVHEVEKLDEIK